MARHDELSYTALEFGIVGSQITTTQNHQDVTEELDLIREELERYQFQLSRLLIELEQSHNQLEEMKLRNIDRKEEELERSQMQVSQLLVELEQANTNLFHIQGELRESESLREQVEVDLEKSQKTLVDTQSVLHKTQRELDRHQFGEAIASQVISARERQYHLLVREAWHAYSDRNINQMIDYLQKSLKYTSLSYTKTISDWIHRWSGFSEQKGEKFDVQKLNNFPEWKQLLRRIAAVKKRL